MRLFKAIVLALFGVAVLVFALSNRQKVVISLFPFGSEVETPLFVVFFVALLLGLGVGGVTSAWLRLKHGVKGRGEAKRVAALEKENAALRADESIRKLAKY